MPNAPNITITYEPTTKQEMPDILHDETPETLAEIEYVRKESEEVAEVRRIILETTEIQPLLCTTT